MATNGNEEYDLEGLDLSSGGGEYDLTGIDLGVDTLKKKGRTFVSGSEQPTQNTPVSSAEPSPSASQSVSTEPFDYYDKNIKAAIKGKEISPMGFEVSPITPATEYEASQKKLVGAQKGLDWAVSKSQEMKQSVYPDVQKQADSYYKSAAVKLGHAQYEADQNISKLKESIKGDLDYVGSNLDNFTRKSQEEDVIADEIKIDEYAKEKAREKGLPEDGYYKNFLYNNVKAEIAQKIIEPDVLKEREKLFKEKTGKTISEAFGKDQEDFAKQFTKGEEIKAVAETQINSVAQEANNLAKAETDSLAKEINAQVNQLNQTYQQQSAQVADEAQANELYKGYTDTFNKLQANFLDAQNQINGKYNARLRRQADEIEKVASQKWEEEVSKYNKEYKPNPELLKQLQETSQEAYKKVVDGKNVVKEVRDLYTPPIVNYARSTISSLGRSLGNISETVGYDYGKVLGDYMENTYQVGSGELKDWKDLLDASKLAKSAGQLTGAMLPSMAAAAATTIATEGMGAPAAVSMLSGGLAAWTGESMDMAGNIERETFAETGDANKALERSKRMWDAQMAIMPLYALEGLPFMKGLSLSKNVGKRMAGGAVAEYVPETLQEYTQTKAEEVINKDKEFSQIFDTASWKEFGHTALNVAPVILLGAGGQIKGEASEKEKAESDAKKFAKTYTKKEEFTELAPDQRDQFLSAMLQQRGVNFTSAFISNLYTSGNISKASANELTKSVGIALEVQNKAKEYGLDQSQQQVFTAFKYKLDAAQRRLAEETDPILKQVAEQRVKELEEQTVNFASGKQADYVVLTYPNNEQYVLSISQAENAAKNKKLIASIQDGSMKVDGVGKGVDVVNVIADNIKAEKKAKVEAEKAGLVAETGAFIQDRIETQNANYAQKEKQDKEAATKMPDSPQAKVEESKPQVAAAEQPAGYSTIALDYLFTGGRDVIQSTDYLLQAMVGGFTKAGKEINAIRNKYAAKIGNIKDDINTDAYNAMMQEIRDVIGKNYTDAKAQEIFDKILKNATGFTSREGNQVSSELDKLNEQQEQAVVAVNEEADIAELESELLALKGETKDGVGEVKSETQAPVIAEEKQAAVIEADKKVAGVSDATKAEPMRTLPAPAQTEPITNKKKIGEHFTKIVKALGKNEVNTLLFDWREAELNEDQSGIKVTGAFKRNAPKGEGASFKESKTAFINWLNSEEPFDEKIYGKDIRNDKEYVDRIQRAREAAGLIEQPLSESRQFAVDYVLADLVDVKPLRPKMTAEEAAKIKARKGRVEDGRKVKSIRKAVKDVGERIDWKMKNEERVRAIRDIKKGKLDSPAAKMLLDRLEYFHNNGAFDFIIGTGGFTTQAGYVPIADVKAHLAEVKALKEEVYADYTEEEIAYFAEQDAAINEIIDAIEQDELNDDENFDTNLKQIQNENKGAEESPIEESVGQDVAGQETIDTKISEVRKRISEKLAKARGELGVNKIPIDVIPDLIELAVLHAEKGVKQFIEFVRESFPELSQVSDKDLEEQIYNEANKTETPTQATPPTSNINDTDKGEGKGGVSDTQVGDGVEKEKRKLTQQFLKDKTIRKEFKEAITEDTIYYDKLPNDVSLQEANKLIETLGEEEAKRAVLDLGNNMKFAVRMIMGEVLIKKMNERGYDEQAVDFVEQFVAITTDMGQGIQALSLFDKLTPEGQVKVAKREAKKQRDKNLKRDKKKTDKIKKAVQKANEEAAEEVVEKVKKKINKVSEIPPISSPKYGEKNKVVTKSEYEKLLKELRGSMFSNVDPRIVKIAAFHIEAGAREFGKFSENMTKALGKKVKPYLKDLYKQAQDLFDSKEGFTTDEQIAQLELEQKGQELKEKISQALKSGNKKPIDAAIAEIYRNGELWGRYKDMAVNRLKRMSLSEIKADMSGKAILDEFTTGLIKNIRQQAEKTGDKSAEKKSAIQIIADAYKNFEKYQEVWAETQEEFKEKYKDNPEKLAELDAYFGDILLKPFSEKLVTQAVKEGLKSLDIKIADIIKDHYTVYEAKKKELVDKLIDEANLSPIEAKELAAEIEKEFDKLATEKKKQYLDKIFSSKERKKTNVKQLYEKIIEATNIGVLSDSQLLDLYADKMGYGKLTPEQANEIVRLANKVNAAPSGHLKFQAIEDLLKYQMNLKHTSWYEVPQAIWYANMLSGHQTHQRNLVANIANTMFLYGNALAQHPTDAVWMAKSLVTGIKKGLLEASDVMTTGYSPIRGKMEIPPILERKTFEGVMYPLNIAKYVRRLMVASDVLLFEGQKEMRSYQLAANMARKEGKSDPTLNMRNRALELMNDIDGALEEATTIANSEMDEKIAEIMSTVTDQDQQKKEIKKAKFAAKRRAYELLEKFRPESIQEQAANFAAKGTYNYTPEGALGVAAKWVNNILGEIPLARYAVPFTNIIANVTNDALNYTPYGLLRWGTLTKTGEDEFSGGSVIGKANSREYNKPLTEQEKVDLLSKAIIGITFMAFMWLLSEGGDDDEPALEITANGTGDWRKNLTLREGGWQPYSVRVKNPVTGKYSAWMSYQYSPLMLALGYIGNIRDFEKYRDEKITDNMLSKYAWASAYSARSLFDMSFLSSANDAMSAFADPRNPDKAEDGLRTVLKTGKTFVIPNIYTQTAKTMQDAMEWAQKENRGTTLGYVLRDIPVARNMYNDQINYLGEPVIPDSDVIISGEKPSKEWALLIKNNLFGSAPHPTKDTYIDESDNKEKSFSQDQFFRYAKNRGGIIKKFLNENYDYLSTLNKEDFRKIMQHVQSEATVYAKINSQGHNFEPDFTEYMNTKKGLNVEDVTEEVVLTEYEQFFYKQSASMKEMILKEQNNPIVVDEYFEKGLISKELYNKISE